MKITVDWEIKDVLKFDRVIIVVDFFRFSTTVNALIFRNKKVLVYSDENKAIEFFSSDNGYDIFSELDLNIKKFDNSPYLAMTENISDKVIVLTNSGSRAVMGMKNAKKIVIASLCNITAVKKYLIDLNDDVMVAPACIFFNKTHIEDFFISEFIKDYINGINRDIEKIKKEIEKSGRIKELKNLRKTADKDLDLIFSLDIFDTVPVAYLKGDFAEVINEKSCY